MFPITQLYDTVGHWSYEYVDWSDPTDTTQNHSYSGAYGFSTEDVCGVEPHAGPSTAVSVAPALPPIPALTYEDPPAFAQPYAYEVQDEWTAAPAMVQHPYPHFGWGARPLVSPPIFHPGSTSSELRAGMGVPVIVISAQTHSPDPSPAPPPVPPSSGPQRTEKRDVNLSPTQIRSFKERLRRARPPGGYKPEMAIAATNNIIKDRLLATGIVRSPRPHFDGELYLEEVLKQLLEARSKTDMYQKLANKLEGMEVVNPSPALRTRPAGSQSHPTSKSEVALRKAEASVQRRLHERTALELASQRFKLPAGKKRFSKTEVLSLALARLITEVDPEGADPTEDQGHPLRR